MKGILRNALVSFLIFLCFLVASAAANPVWLWQDSNLVKLNENLQVVGTWSYGKEIDPGGIVFDEVGQCLWLNDKFPEGSVYRIDCYHPDQLEEMKMDLPPELVGGNLRLKAVHNTGKPTWDLSYGLDCAMLGGGTGSCQKMYADNELWLYANGKKRLVKLNFEGWHMRTIHLPDFLDGMDGDINGLFLDPVKTTEHMTYMKITDGKRVWDLTADSHVYVGASDTNQEGERITHLAMADDPYYFWYTDHAAKRVVRCFRSGYTYVVDLELEMNGYPLQVAESGWDHSAWIVAEELGLPLTYSLHKYNLDEGKWAFSPIGGLEHTSRLDIDPSDGACLVRDGNTIKRFSPGGELLCQSPSFTDMRPFFVQKYWLPEEIYDPLSRYRDLPFTDRGVDFEPRGGPGDRDGRRDDGRDNGEDQAPGVFFVDPSGSNTDGTGDYNHPWKDIQYAIDQSAPGSTIQVAAGTYVEKLSINKDIHLKGEGIDETIIKVMDGEEEPVVMISGDVAVYLHDLTIGAPNCQGNPHRGLIAEDAYVSLYQVKLVHILNVHVGLSNCTFNFNQIAVVNKCTIPWGDVGDIGIRLAHSNGTVANSFLGYNIDHVIDARSGSEVEVRDSFFIGNDYNWGHAIRLLGCSYAEVKDNYIVGWNHGVPPESDYSGMLVADHSAALVEGNWIWGWGTGISTGSNGLVVAGFNTIMNNCVDGVATAEWTDIGFNPDLGDGMYGSLGNNTFSGNGEYNVRNANPHPLSARYNWWETTGWQEIAESIYDYWDDPAVGKVDYSQYLTSSP